MYPLPVWSSFVVHPSPTDSRRTKTNRHVPSPWIPSHWAQAPYRNRPNPQTLSNAHLCTQHPSRKISLLVLFEASSKSQKGQRWNRYSEWGIHPYLDSPINLSNGARFLKNDLWLSRIMAFGFVMILVPGHTICTRNTVMYPALWQFNRCIKIWLLDIVLDSVPYMYKPPSPYSHRPFGCWFYRLSELSRSRRQRMSNVLIFDNCSLRISSFLFLIVCQRVLGRKSSRRRDLLHGNAEIEIEKGRRARVDIADRSL